MKAPTHDEPKIVAAAERQMQAWVKTQEIQDRAICLRRLERMVAQTKEYLTISREAGAGGSEIAQLAGRELVWETLDRDLLGRVAERFGLSRFMLKLVDETRSSWLRDVFGTFIDRKIVPHEKYVAHLARVVRFAARQDNVVLVGRGAQFLLPREKGFAVRIIAPMKYRIEQIMQRESLGEENARQLIEEVDQGRREFVERYFHHDINDPHLYDLVINVERIGIAGAVEQIITALRRHAFLPDEVSGLK